MGLAPFQRALARGLSRLGKDSTLDGVPCGRVNVARGVDMFAGSLDDGNDNHVARADLATIDAAFNPRAGQTLVHPDGTFRLMRLVESNGYNVTHIVVQVP